MSNVDELIAAIRGDDMAAAGGLLAARPALANDRDAQGNTPLLLASYAGRTEAVCLLLQHGARPSLFEACALGLVDDVRRELREAPAVVGQYAHDSWPPLHLAAYFGHRETAEVLLDAGADVLAVSRNAEENLAINAAAAGPRSAARPAIVTLLIDRGSPVDGRGSPRGHTPLHEAAFNGDVALVRLLLDRGADRSLCTGDGRTALQIAGERERAEVVRLLGG
jgi:ankyrin repeat protein